MYYLLLLGTVPHPSFCPSHGLRLSGLILFTFGVNTQRPINIAELLGANEWHLGSTSDECVPLALRNPPQRVQRVYNYWSDRFKQHITCQHRGYITLTKRPMGDSRPLNSPSALTPVPVVAIAKHKRQGHRTRILSTAVDRSSCHCHYYYLGSG